MTATLEDLLEDYALAMRDYLEGSGEAALRRAYELGRRALFHGWGVLDMTAMHQKCIGTLEGQLSARLEPHEAREKSLNFLAESLSPFEMVLRGFQDTNARLRQSLKDLRLARDQLRRQNEILTAVHNAVQAERQRYHELFDFAPNGYLVTDLEGTIREVNSAAASLFRMPQAALADRSLLDFVVADERAAFRARLVHLQGRGPANREEWQTSVIASDGNVILVALTVGAECTSAGVLSGLRWLLHDVTALKRAAEERTKSLVGHAEAEAAHRFEFLAKASAVLAGSLDCESNLASVARLAVPYLADWCFLHVFEPDGTIRQLEVVHASCVLPPGVADLQRVLGPGTRERAGLFARVVEPQIFEPIDDAWLEEFANCSQDVATLRKLQFRCAMIIPLVTHGRGMGALSMVLAQSGHSYNRTDLLLAEDLARRCALAVDNARLYREVVEERDRSESANRAKDEFLAILSHELRNPLMPVLGWARVFKNHNTITGDAVLAEGARALERNAEHIGRIVGDCLDFGRISQGNIQLEKKLVDLNEVILTSTQAVRELALDKKLDFLVELSERPLWTLGDAIRLRQVFLNLLMNAIKFTECGGQVLIRSSQRGRDAQIEVHDTGIGIEPDFLEKIFQPFRQGAGHWLTSESGLGLGLAIAQRIVRMQGGEILAHSKGLGSGSTFQVMLPLSVQPGREITRTAVHSDQAPMASTSRILFIEDSKDILFLFKVELEVLGYTVLTADTAVKGLEMAIRERPDLIVSDIKMPGVDGYELIRRIRQVEELAETPAIALTGFSARVDRDKALAAGFNACLSKPVEAGELSALIKKLTEK